MAQINLIVAMAANRVIGVDNTLPWHIPADMKRFRQLTTGQTVLMGRKTYESLPEKFRPLPDRKNVVVSQSRSATDFPAGVELVSEPQQYIRGVKQGDIPITGQALWVIGGQKIYEISLPLCDSLYLTRVTGIYPGDAFFPPFESNFQVLAIEEGDGYSFEHLTRIDS